jgi:S1-C subfamily serine protease
MASITALRGRPAAALLATVALGAGVAACGGRDDGSNSGAQAPKEVTTTKVQVVEGLGKKGGFDPSALYDRLSPGVVTILSLFDGSANPLSQGGDQEGGQGSGFVIDSSGLIATNAHVVTSGDPPNTKKAKQVYVEFSDGNRIRASIVGADLNADVALLRIAPGGLDLTPLRLGHSRELIVGAPVAAIGSPFGERQSLSVGVVSAVDRNIDSLTQFSIGNAIQTDAAINPGNSGGPLLNGKGQVLGINSQIKSTSGGGEGVGFAIPVDTVRRSLRELRKDGKVEYGYLGVTSQPLYPQLARRLKIKDGSGALVVNVQKGSPADRAGLDAGDDKIEFQGQQDIPSDGDVIVAVDGKKLSQADDLADLVSRRAPGDEIELDVVRQGKHRTVKVKLGTRPERRPQSQQQP